MRPSLPESDNRFWLGFQPSAKKWPQLASRSLLAHHSIGIWRSMEVGLPFQTTTNAQGSLGGPTTRGGGRGSILAGTVGIVALSLVLLLTGCGSALEQARRAEGEGRTADALRHYRILSRAGAAARQAPFAQARVVALLAKLRRWHRVPAAASRLAAFFDTEDAWWERFSRREPRHVAAMRQNALVVLLSAARAAEKGGIAQGVPAAVSASGNLCRVVLALARQRSRETRECRFRLARALLIQGRAREARPIYSALIVPGGKGALDLRARKGELAALLVVGAAAKGKDASTATSGARAAAPGGRPGPKSSKTPNRRVPGAGTAGKPKAIAPTSGDSTSRALVAAARLIATHPRRGSGFVGAQAEQQWRNGRQLTAVRLWLVVVRADPAGPNGGRYGRRIVRAFGTAGDWIALRAEIRAFLKSHGSKAPRPLIRSFREILLTATLRDLRRAIKERRRILPVVKGLVRQLPQLAGFRRLPGMLYRHALKLEDMRQFDSAARIFDGLARTWPYNRLAPMALYSAAQAWRSIFQAKLAGDAFMRLALKYRRSPIAPRALYHAFGVYSKSGYSDLAKRAGLLLFRRYPKSAEVRRLRGGGRRPRRNR